MKNTVTMLRERLFSIIRRLGENPERYARKPGRDFTRKRMLTPDVLIQLIVTMDEKSISSGRSCFHPRSKICFTASRIVCARKRSSGATDCWPWTVRR